MAKLGLLYLKGGRWNEQQVIPQAWVDTSVASHIVATGGRDYAYLFWVFPDRGYYAALGLGGQDIYVVPARNMVVVITAGVDSPTNDQVVIKLLDEYIVPAASSAQSLPDNPVALDQLTEQSPVGGCGGCESKESQRSTSCKAEPCRPVMQLESHRCLG